MSTLYKEKNPKLNKYALYTTDERNYTIRQVTVDSENIQTECGCVIAYIDDYILTDNVLGDEWVCRLANFTNRFEIVS